VSEVNFPMESHGPALMEASPFAIPSKKLVMWLFIISDAVTFTDTLRTPVPTGPSLSNSRPASSTSC